MGLFSSERKERKTGELTADELVRPAPAQPAKPKPEYGIDRAIELMRVLPQGDDHLPLVVQVIRQTLASTEVSVESIIDDATRKQDRIQARIAQLQDEIENLERDIETRVAETRALEADFAETSRVKARLQLPEREVTSVSAPARQSASALSEPGPSSEAAADVTDDVELMPESESA